MDINYWDNFYKKKHILKQSSFADFCVKHFNLKKKNIIELGYGNARDASFFCRKNNNVLGIDQNKTIFKNLDDETKKFIKSKKLNLVIDDFVKTDYSKFDDYDVVYSRFTIHSISKSDQNTLLSKIYNFLPNKGIFFIEARTTKDKLFGKGKKITNNAFFTDHYRRFIDTDEFIKNILKIGFKIKYFDERNNLSIYKDDNPFLMRIVLEKN